MQEIYGKHLIASTLPGLEKVLEKELQQLGAVQTEIIRRGVSFRFHHGILMKANLASRISLRILAPVFRFTADSPVELYKIAVELPWENYQIINHTFAIHFAIHSTLFSHSQFATLKLKDAICDRFRKLKDRRPDIDTRQPDVSWHLHIHNNQVTISLDSSGESLHIRGYKSALHPAPMSEVLAAGLIYLSEWDARITPFTDGMCGSGTIAIEAALMAARRAPNLHRRYFPFRQWLDHDPGLYQRIREDLIQDSRSDLPPIRAFDISRKAVDATMENARKAGIGRYVQVNNKPFEETEANSPSGLILLNPPYGERMQEEDVEKLYKTIGDTLKHHYKGWKAGIISSNAPAMKAIRLHSYNTFKLINGKLPADFKLYEIF
jgi:putative N6-adenine-specific DNA methylase